MPIRSLPFVSKSTKWCVSASGDWETDFTTGKKYADMALKVALKHDRLYLVPFIIKDMEEFGAVEMGFLNRVAEHAITSPLIA